MNLVVEQDTQWISQKNAENPLWLENGDIVGTWKLSRIVPTKLSPNFYLTGKVIKMKYKKQSKINDCALTAESLGVDFRCSTIGISIVGVEETKFFHVDELMKNKSRCINFIKNQSLDLQTHFL